MKHVILPFTYYLRFQGIYKNKPIFKFSRTRYSSQQKFYKLSLKSNFRQH